MLIVCGLKAVLEEWLECEHLPWGSRIMSSNAEECDYIAVLVHELLGSTTKKLKLSLKLTGYLPYTG